MVWRGPTQLCLPECPGILVCLPGLAAPAGAQRVRAGRHILGDTVPTRALPSSRTARTPCQHPSRPSREMLGANAPSLPGWFRLQEEGRACIPSVCPYTWEGPGAQPRPSRHPAPPQIHRAQPPPGVLEPAGTGGLSSSILGSTSSYASSKAPWGTFSKGAPSSCHPKQECGVPWTHLVCLGEGLSPPPSGSGQGLPSSMVQAAASCQKYPGWLGRPAS